MSGQLLISHLVGIVISYRVEIYFPAESLFQLPSGYGQRKVVKLLKTRWNKIKLCTFWSGLVWSDFNLY